MLKYIQLNPQAEGRPVCFSATAIEEIYEGFGDFVKWQESLTSGDVKAINKTLEIAFRAGELYCKGFDIECPPPLKCRPSDIILFQDLNRIVEELFEAFVEDTKREIETQGN